MGHIDNPTSHICHTRNASSDEIADLILLGFLCNIYVMHGIRDGILDSYTAPMPFVPETIGYDMELWMQCSVREVLVPSHPVLSSISNGNILQYSYCNVQIII